MFSKYYLNISQKIAKKDFDTFLGINLPLPTFMNNSIFKLPECKTLKEDCGEKEHEKGTEDFLHSK